MDKDRPEAMDIIGLQLYADSVKGTKNHAAALKALEETKAKWLENLHNLKCPHCGKLIPK